MAQTLGLNRTFPIYHDVSGVKTPFHNLVLRKATYESVVMSLGDKITGDVYYADNNLTFSMQEYVEYKSNPDDVNEQAVKFYLVSPPTVIREGMVSDNSELKGMTKYSLTFYHPMHVLNDFPFADVAVSEDEKQYLSENKTFSWIGNPVDFVAKLNKNLQGTKWGVVISSSLTNDSVLSKMSDVMAFDNISIGEALKKMYETWKLPFVIDNVSSAEKADTHSVLYNKDFKIVVGLPSEEITVSGNPFTFHYGQGVGLKNNSRNPRNNKIVTRIAGSGSENNIPYGYPQIRWYGDPTADFTYGSAAGVYTNVTIEGHEFPKVVSYPLYMGVLDGQWVKLIKHPFTRSVLMPTAYRTTLFNKVSPYLSNGSINTSYDPDLTIIDYYDAVAGDPQYIYSNLINPQSPSYEYHQFEEVKPEMRHEDENNQLVNYRLVGVTPLDKDLQSVGDWDDTLDDEGKYKQNYFQITIPKLDFDLYACASLTEEMQINMRSGACLGCTFNVLVDWEDYKRNFYDEDGNFVPDGEQRDLTKYPKSNLGQISVVVQKDNQTFGALMPNSYQNPHGESASGANDGDEFVVLGISLPEEYITNAEGRLDEEMKSYMLENNIHYFDYPLKFDEHFLATHTNILTQIKPNTVVQFNYADSPLKLYVKQLVIKFGDNPLPQYDITLTDDIDVVLNPIGQVSSEIDNLSALITALRLQYGNNIWTELSKKLSKVNDDTASGNITFAKNITVKGDAITPSIQSPNFVSDEFAGTGWAIQNDANGISTAEVDRLNVRMRAVFNELEIRKVSYSGGNIIWSSAGNKILKVVPLDSACQETTSTPVVYRCCWLHNDGTDVSHNDWSVGDQARCQTFNGTATRYYWRKVLQVGEDYTVDDITYNYVDLANATSGTYNGTAFTNGVQMDITNDAPMEGDAIVQMGCQDNTKKERQNFIMLSVNSVNAPAIIKYLGVNSFSFDNKVIQSDEFIHDTIHNVDKYNSTTYGDWYVGTKTGVTPENYAKFNSTNGRLEIKGSLNIGSELADGRDINALGTSRQNMLRNSGFTGDFDSELYSSSTEMSADTEVFSDPLSFWAHNEDVEVDADDESMSGKAVILGDGSDEGYIEQEVQDVDLVLDRYYILSFYASGFPNIKVSFGGMEKTIPITHGRERYSEVFQCTDVNDTIIRLTSTNATISEIILTEGSVIVEWKPSEQDNNKAVAAIAELDYLKQAINQGETSIIGGLILTNLIKVGTYGRNNARETGGMNGLVNDDQSPYLWGGGTLEQAIHTIAKYAENPSYIATDAEVATMAKFVVTHGGRAILNDIILRGYIDALGGRFHGRVEAEEGVFSQNVQWNLGNDGTRSVIMSATSGTLNIQDSSVSNYPLIKFKASNAWEGGCVQLIKGLTGTEPYPAYAIHAPQGIIYRKSGTGQIEEYMIGWDGNDVNIYKPLTTANDVSVGGNLIITGTITGAISGLKKTTRRITSNTTLAISDCNVIVGGTNDITITLPTSAAEGQEYFIKSNLTSNYTLTIQCSGSDRVRYWTSDGSQLQDATSLTIQSNSSRHSIKIIRVTDGANIYWEATLM